MSKKQENIHLRIPSDKGRDFTEEREVLTHRPSINWEEPEYYDDPEYTSVKPQLEKKDLQEGRERIKAVIAGFRAVEKLADAVEKKIDDLVGSYKVKLDPVIDAPVIAALKRQFPNKTDFNSITYDDYKKSLKKIEESSEKAPAITATDIEKARKTIPSPKIGGLGIPAGDNRAEISSIASKIIKPIDQNKFQEDAVKALFKLMQPLIDQADKASILQHILDKHGG